MAQHVLALGRPADFMMSLRNSTVAFSFRLAVTISQAASKADAKGGIAGALDDPAG